MRAWLVLASLVPSLSFAQSSIKRLSCYGYDKTGADLAVSTDENGGLRLERTDDEGDTRVTALATRFTVRKTSKANMYNVVDGNGKTVMTLKHDGLPSNLRAEASLGGGRLMNCVTDAAFVSFAAPATRSQFCANRKDLANVQNLLKDQSNRLSFPNGPYGLAKGGVCWWHNMFERNAAYLAIFNPKAAKPDRGTGLAIIEAIKSGREVVVVNGYRNLREFSADYRVEIIRSLEQWQIADGAAFGWIRGLTGKPEVPPEQMKKTMDDTYDVVKVQKQVAFHMLQLKGITAHAWLVIDMKKTADGYELLVADSNSLMSRKVVYRYGMTKFYEYNAAPHLQTKYLRDTASMIQIGDRACGTARAASAVADVFSPSSIY